MKHLRIILSFVLILATCQINAQQSELLRNLRSIPQIEKVTAMEPDAHFSEKYEIYFRQPLDHSNPGKGSFLQQMVLSHVAENRPMVIETDGYKLHSHKCNELSGLLQANQLVVEYRYFGKSLPDTMDYQYLTLKQSVDDYHAIVTALKTIYQGKWASTGISKGGQTTLYYRYFYPEDVDVSVPYVAPLNFAREDPRIYTFLDTVGTEACRAKILAFQRSVLERREEMLPRFKWFSIGRNYKFNWLTEEEAFEYLVLEYPFSFWQWGSTSCEEIPAPDATADKLFDHLRKNVSPYYYADLGIQTSAPFMYQAQTELGYYGYETHELEGLLKAATKPDNRVFSPKGSNPEYQPELNLKVDKFLRTRGNNILYIYGGQDTWSATAVQSTGKTNSVKMMLPGGAHGTRIRHFKHEMKQKIYDTLESWMEVEIQDASTNN